MMPIRRLVLLALPLLVGCKSLRDRELADRFAAAARSNTSTGGFVAAMCGWDPPLYASYEARDVRVSTRGDDEAGTGEVTASVALPGGHVCAGTASFRYRKHHSPNRASSLMIAELHRVGAWPPVVDEIARVATPIAYDTPVALAFGAWTTPDGRPAVAHRVDVAAPGKRCFRLKVASHAEASFTVYQKGAPVIDPGGAISNLTLDAGPAYVLVASASGSPATLTVGSTGCP